MARREGYARDELIDAAAEAGIEPRFLELALREQALAKGGTSTGSDAALLRWLGTRQRSLSVSRIFDADLKTMVAASCRVSSPTRSASSSTGKPTGTCGAGRTPTSS